MSLRPRSKGKGLLEKLNNPSISDDTWASDFETWALDTVSFVAGSGAAVLGTAAALGLVTAASPALIATLGVVSIAAGVAAGIVDHNEGAQLPSLSTAIRHLDDTYQQIRNKFDDVLAAASDLKDRVADSAEDALSALGQYVADKSEEIKLGARNLINNPVAFFQDAAGAFYNFHAVTLPNKVQQFWKTTREFIGDIEIVKMFDLDDADPDEPGIIVTANRRTGETSYQFLKEWENLLNHNESGQGLADTVLDFARSGTLYDTDALVGIVSSAALKTLGDNLGESLDAALFGKAAEVGDNIEDVFQDFDRELLTNLKSAGIGAVSSFLTAELVNAIGLDGFAGTLANSSAGAYVGAIVAALPALVGNTATLGDVLGSVNVGNVIGGFVGSYLASKVVSFDTVGGQIGSSVGAALGGIAATSTSLGLVHALSFLSGAAGPVGAAIGAFVGFLAGGLIGSIFGGTPRSGADSIWDSESGQFVVANVWSKKGGSKDAARSVATAVSEMFNAVLAATGGTLLTPELVQAGNYGMRKKAFVYKPYSTRSSDAITQKFSGKDAAAKLIGYGVHTGLTDPDFQIAGGDIYVKRALYNTFELGGIDPRDFDTSIVLGNISSAQAYESYLANSTVINALVSAEPNSAFAIETLLTLARADELGLTRRAASDWYGGFSFLLEETGANAAQTTIEGTAANDNDNQVEAMVA